MPEPLSHPVGVLYEIRWKEICPWLILVKALRVALLLRVLVLATVGALLSQGGNSLIERVLVTPELTPPTAAESISPDAYLSISQSPDSQSLLDTLSNWSSGPLVEAWHQVSEPFIQLADRELPWQSSIALLIRNLWLIVVWTIFGGAISRIAAMYITRGETLGPIASLKYAFGVGSGTAGAPLITLLFAAVVAFPLLIVGMLLNFNFIAIIAGLLWVFVYAWGFMLAVILLGLLLGWPLMWACQAVEQSDAFDGVSRCYAYIRQRPLHLLFFLFVATVLGYLGEAVVVFFSSTLVATAEWTLSLGMSSERTAELFASDWQATSVPWAVRSINGWKWALDSVVAAFPLACLWPMSVAIYLLLRRLIDATEMDEIALAENTSATALPPLSPAPSGVPEVEQPSTNGNVETNGEKS